MFHHGPARLGLRLVVLAPLVTLLGCTNYHYYGVPGSVASSTIEPSAIGYGSVCEVPSTVEGGTVVVQGAPIVQPTPRLSQTPRVLTSEPRLAGASGWRRVDADDVATTKVDGGVEAAGTVRR